MALIEVNTNPSTKELKWFGLVIVVLFAIVGGTVFFVSGNTKTPIVLLCIGGLLAGLYYALPPLRKLMYIAWMRAVLPIGWTISHLLFGTVYFLVFTLIGSAMRLFGRDSMQRQFNRNASTYWVERKPTTEPSRYFSQF